MKQEQVFTLGVDLAQLGGSHSGSVHTEIVRWNHLKGFSLIYLVVDAGCHLTETAADSRSTYMRPLHVPWVPHNIASMFQEKMTKDTHTHMHARARARVCQGSIVFYDLALGV